MTTIKYYAINSTGSVNNIYNYFNTNVTFGDYICGSGGLIDSSPALGVVYEVSVWSPW